MAKDGNRVCSAVSLVGVGSASQRASRLLLRVQIANMSRQACKLLHRDVQGRDTAVVWVTTYPADDPDGSEAVAFAADCRTKKKRLSLETSQIS